MILEDQLVKRNEKIDLISIENSNINLPLDNLEKKIEKIYEFKIKGAQIRSRSKWIEVAKIH